MFTCTWILSEQNPVRSNIAKKEKKYMPHDRFKHGYHGTRPRATTEVLKALYNFFLITNVMSVVLEFGF